jgi:bifunctional DNase/RNase
VFYATLFVRVNGQAHEVDARPSDALNLALRLNAPIFVAAEVMEVAGVMPDALSAKLASGQSRPEAEIEWVSVPAPDVNLPARTEKKG